MHQLRIKTEYTFGKTYAPIPKVIERLKAIGCTVAGIVDENSTWGHIPWYDACKAANIVPLLGVELVVSEDDTEHTMWFLAKNPAGLREMYNFTSQAHQQLTDNKWSKRPRLFHHQVIDMSNDVWKFSGSITDMNLLSSIDNVIFDLSPASKIINHKKEALAADFGNDIVVVSDNLHISLEDEHLFQLMSRPRKKPTAQHILSQDEMAVYGEVNCQENFAAATFELPSAPMIFAQGDLRAMAVAGKARRNIKWTQSYTTRMDYELALIKSKGYESYFIIVADMVDYAKRHMLVGPSRGSSAGSLICYLLGITEVDPIPPGLLFERFIDVNRMDLPDIDIDFPDNKRQMVFDYMTEKYGAEHTAHIGTVGKFQSKSALGQVCKVLGVPIGDTITVKTAMIERSSADARASHCLEDTFTGTEPGRDFIKRFPAAMDAMLLEGHASHTGVHAAGLLVCNDDIQNYCTIDGNGIAQIDKHGADRLGLLKIDVLGLRTLGILEDSGVAIDWYNLPLDDSKALAIFNNLKYCGIFQYEGEAMRSVAELVANGKGFQGMNEIDAVCALARPGPFAGGVTRQYLARLNDNAPWEAIHPMVSSYMDYTFGLPIYQEQTMGIVRDIGKFSWELVTTVRKAIAKTMGREFFDKHWPQFRDGAKANGVQEEAARKIWEMINTMGSWQMNKAHTYSYAVISYWCAYLKAHHPLEFAAANLRNAAAEKSAIRLLREMAQEGIEYVAFDIEKSKVNWSVQDGKLYGGFMNLKGVGEKKAEKYIQCRDSEKGLSKKQLETLEASDNPFSNLFPIETFIKHYDDHMEGYMKVLGLDINIASKLHKVNQLVAIEHKGMRTFFAELIDKNPRNVNEEALIKRRIAKDGHGANGQVESKYLEYVDLTFQDDSETIGGRISRWDYAKFGKDLVDNVPVGAILLIRAQFFCDTSYNTSNLVVGFIRYAFVKKWKMIAKSMAELKEMMADERVNRL